MKLEVILMWKNKAKDEWHDPEFVIHWDQTSLMGNPTRAEQMDLLLAILDANCRQGDHILDLGIGSAHVEQKLFSKRNDLHVVGIDSSKEMLELAKQRVNSTKIDASQCILIEHDLNDIHSLILPHKSFRAVISVQTLHHLPYSKQQEIIHYICELLDQDGLFILMDRIQVQLTGLEQVYQSMWNWLEMNANVKSGWSAEYFLERLQQKDDYVVSLQDLLHWLQEVGFKSSCLHLSLNRALIVGVKK